MLRRLCLVTVLPAGCVAAALAVGCGPHRGPQKAAGPAALTAEESRVRAWVLDNAHDPESVRFDRWGPHLGPEGGEAPPGTTVVRVRYRALNRQGARELSDVLVGLQGDRVLWAVPNQAGDDWREEHARAKKWAADFWKPPKGEPWKPPPQKFTPPRPFTPDGPGY
jgi:hypothetical protein